MKILVIALQQLGDVLLATPLMNQIKQQHPHAQIDVLVFADTASILEGNPDIHHVLSVTRRFDALSDQTHWRFVRSLWRRWDLAIVALPSDRSHLYALSAAPRRIGYVHTQGSKNWWQKLALKRWLVFPELQHRVQTFSQLANLVDLASSTSAVGGAVVAPRSATLESSATPPTAAFAVLHASPRVTYKRWPHGQWQALVQALQQRGLQVVVGGGPGEQEHTYNNEVFGNCAGVIRKDGQLSLAQWTTWLSKATLYVGVDTSTTHLAAACGTPTVALFGPTNPLIWGPVSNVVSEQSTYMAQLSHYQPRPPAATSPIQWHHRVALVQNPDHACMPCQEEGCERHRQSRADCLDTMPLQSVLQAIDQLLA